MGKVPKQLQSILWSTDVKLLDLDKHKNYIIHQVLSYGRLEEIRWLFKTYSKKTIQRVFTLAPYKDYNVVRFHFVKDYLLDLKHYSLDERRYVKNTPRYLG